jgi:hypothetical protein
MLTFSPTPFTLWTGIAAWLLVAFLAFVSWRRSGRRRRTLVLEITRCVAAAVVVLLLWQPEWKTILNPDSKPRIAVLWDDSKSMETLDAERPVGSAGEAGIVSRAAWVREVLKSDRWKALEAGGANETLFVPFSTPDPQKPALSGTDLDKPLSDLLGQEGNLRAVVMISDGDSNQGQPPVAAAQKLRVRGVPLFAVPVGSPVRLPDIDLVSVTAPTYGIVGENVQIPFVIRSSLDREVRTKVRLRDEKGREESVDVVLSPDAETYGSLVWRLDTEGASTLEMSVPVVPGERIESNNASRFVISGKQERIRVLVVETLPRWEYRFLRNALSRDPGVELSCLLFHPDLGIGDGPDYVREFPKNATELAKYDVVFLGDVGVDNDQLTPEQCEMIRGLVENQASGVVFMPGAQGNQFSLLKTGLSELMPVILDDSKKQGIRESTAAPLALTREGRESLLTMLGADAEENPVVWRNLPGFYWHAPVVRSKAGTETLAVHGNRRGEFGSPPLLVTKPAGSGKVLFMGIDSAWRWRRGVEDLYHYRFWGQVARWMSYQRNMAAGERVRVFFTPERPAPGTVVTLNANAFEPDGAPLDKGAVFVDIISPDGRAERIELAKNGSEWGAFNGKFKVDLPGEWKLRAVVAGAEDKPVETTVLAQGTEVEKTGQPAKPEVLEEMARVAKGRVIAPEKLDELIREISALPEPRPVEKRLPLWSHAAVLAGLIALLGSFWAARKLTGEF